VAVFLTLRLSLLWLFNKATGGRELASDVVFHVLIVKDPFAILNGTAIHIASYPPFQWLIEWPLFNFYASFLNEMVSYRMLMITVEVFVFILLLKACNFLVRSKPLAVVLATLFIVSPHQYLATVFFVQEDIIAQCFMLAAFIALYSGHRSLSIAIMSAGFLIAKMFFLIPLFYVIFFSGDRKFVRRIIDGVLAVTPMVIVYYITITNALANGGEVPIRDFTPDAKYAANYWVMLLKAFPEQLVQVKNASLLLSLIAQVVLIAVFFNLHYIKKIRISPAVLLTIPLVVFFATFYQHMPEYFLMLWPLVAIFCTTIWQQLVVAALFSVAWAPRIFHGFKRVTEQFGTAAEARTDILGPFISMDANQFEFLNQIALIVQSILYTLLLIWLCKRAINLNSSLNMQPR